MLYKVRNEAIQFYDGYSLIMSEAKTNKNKTIQLKEQGLKYLHLSKCFKDYQ